MLFWSQAVGSRRGNTSSSGVMEAPASLPFPGLDLGGVVEKGGACS